MRAMSLLRRRRDAQLAAVVCGLACVATWLGATSGALRAIAGVAILLGVVIIAVVLVALVVAPRAILRKRESLRAPIGVDASDEGITVTTGDRSRTIPWSSCQRVESNRRIIAVFHGGDAGEQVLLVPHRAFRDTRRAKAFVAMLEGHVGRVSESGKA
jgi:YcxB-like protein